MEEVKYWVLKDFYCTQQKGFIPWYWPCPQYTGPLWCTQGLGSRPDQGLLLGRFLPQPGSHHRWCCTARIWFGDWKKRAQNYISHVYIGSIHKAMLAVFRLKVSCCKRQMHSETFWRSWLGSEQRGATLSVYRQLWEISSVWLYCQSHLPVVQDFRPSQHIT